MPETSRPLPFLDRIPALADNAVLRYFTFAVLYFAQGIPSGVLLLAFPAWMATHGKTPLEIGTFLAVIMLPWTFKIIAAPLMDRFTYLPMGRRKPWVLFGQGGLAAGFIALSMVSKPLEQLPVLMAIGFIIGLFGIFQDISIDSLAVDLLPEDEQARANGLMWGSKIVGKAATLAAGSYLLNHVGYGLTLLIFSGLIIGIMAVPLLLRERKGEKLFPGLKGQASALAADAQTRNWFALLKNVFRVFLLPASLCVALSNFFFSTGEGLMDAILPVFTPQHLGWSDTEYSKAYSSATMISGLLAMFVGGPLIDFFGKKRMMMLYIVLLIALVTSLLLLRHNWDNRWLIRAFFISFYTFNVFNVVTIFAMAMSVSWRRVAATQFTLYMTIGNLGLSLGSWLMGALKTIASWEMVLLAYIPLAALGFVFTALINFRRQKASIQLLEKNFNSAHTGPKG